MKHQQIVDHLRARIATGAFKSGDRLPSFVHLHRQFGAASKTVERAIDVLELDGLIERRKRSGIYVSGKVPSSRCRRIALHGTGDSNMGTDYWARFLNGAHSAARKLGAELALPFGGESIDWEHYSGVVTVGAVGRVASSDLPDGFPVVSVSDSIPGRPSIGLDEFDAGFIATRHLVDLGHRRIGYLSWLSSMIDMKRLAGYRYALNSTDHGYDERFVQPLMHDMANPTLKEAGRFSLLHWIDNGFDSLNCSALIVQNDWAAVGVIEALIGRGYRVPQDMGVIGFDNERDCVALSPTLTSVAGDMYELGYQSLMQLASQWEGRNANPCTTFLPVSVYARESTGPRT